MDQEQVTNLCERLLKIIQQIDRLEERIMAVESDQKQMQWKLEKEDEAA